MSFISDCYLGIRPGTVIIDHCCSDFGLEAYLPERRKKPVFSFLKDRKTVWQAVVVTVWFILGCTFIVYAKHKATHIEAYHTHHLNHPFEILASLNILFYSIWKILIFSSENFMESIYTWAIIAGLPIILVLSNTRSHFVKFCSSHKLMIFFALNGILTFFLLIISHWVFLNGTARRYFTIVYISLWVATLLYIEWTGSRNRQLRMIILLIVVLLGSISSINKFFLPETTAIPDNRNE